MEMNKRIENLEDDFKLLKNELKQTITSVREAFMALQSQPRERGILLGQQMQGKIEAEYQASDDAIPELPSQDANEQQPELDQPEETQEETSQDTSAEEIMKEEDEVRKPVAQINMLTNLIRWVAAAKKEIGSEQLAAFLEVYSIAGCLPSESKEVIQHVADMVEQQSADVNAVDIWTRLTLELHGILSGGGQPLRLPDLSNNEKKNYIEQNNTNDNGAKMDKLIKLKLVLPGENGEEKEFGITLSPAVDGKSI